MLSLHPRFACVQAYGPDETHLVGGEKLPLESGPLRDRITDPCVSPLPPPIQINEYKIKYTLKE